MRPHEYALCVQQGLLIDQRDKQRPAFEDPVREMRRCKCVDLNGRWLCENPADQEDGVCEMCRDTCRQGKWLLEHNHEVLMLADSWQVLGPKGKELLAQYIEGYYERRRGQSLSHLRYSAVSFNDIDISGLLK